MLNTKITIRKASGISGLSDTFVVRLSKNISGLTAEDLKFAVGDIELYLEDIKRWASESKENAENAEIAYTDTKKLSDELTETIADTTTKLESVDAKLEKIDNIIDEVTVIKGDITKQAEEVAVNTKKAQAAASSASASADAATDQATKSSNSANAAKLSEDNAKTSETNAKTSETNAGVSASEAKSSAESAKDSLTKSEDAAINAKLSETNAKESELVATTKASEADISAKSAKDSETKASASENAAKLSETSAKTSETKAKASEVAAKSSEEKVAADALAADKSAGAAKLSEDNAKTSETNAKASEVVANSSALSAKTSEDNAKTSETKAKASEVAASKDADAANLSAIDALECQKKACECAAKAEFSEKATSDAAESAMTHASNAGVSAANADISATKAKASETNAASSETRATTQADRAKTEADRAEEAANNAAAGGIGWGNIVGELGDDEKKLIHQKGLTGILGGKIDTSSIVQTTGSSISEIMSQKSVTDELNKKVDSGNLEQTTGSNIDKVMSQKSVTDELSKKLDSTNIVQEIGNATDKVMSQKLVTDELDKKLDASSVVQVTGISTTVTMSQKSVTDELGKKANIDSPNFTTKATIADEDIATQKWVKENATKIEIEQSTGTATDKVMSQDATTKAIDLKLDKSSVVQVTGESVDNIISQKIVTDELNKKANIVSPNFSTSASIDNKPIATQEWVGTNAPKVEILQELGESTDKVMSQKAVTEEFGKLVNPKDFGIGTLEIPRADMEQIRTVLPSGIYSGGDGTVAGGTNGLPVKEGVLFHASAADDPKKQVTIVVDPITSKTFVRGTGIMRRWNELYTTANTSVDRSGFLNALPGIMISALTERDIANEAGNSKSYVMSQYGATQLLNTKLDKSVITETVTTDKDKVPSNFAVSEALKEQDPRQWGFGGAQNSAIYLNSSYDLDNITACGEYQWLNNPANAPYTFSWMKQTSWGEGYQQLLISSTGHIAIRSKPNNRSPWRAWYELYSTGNTSVDPNGVLTTKQNTVTLTTNDLANEFGNSTAKTVNQKIVTDALDSRFRQNIALGTTDLNTLFGIEKQGIWYQSANANSTTAMNYPPSGHAGNLVVLYNRADEGTIQKYIEYSNGTEWIRTLTNGKWSSWIKTIKEGTTPSFTDVTITSDRRAKENINVIDKPLERLSKLKGSTFNYKDSGNQSGGIIAQDLLEALPEGVDQSDPEQLKVHYNAVIGLLVNAVNELSSRVKKLEDK